MWLSGNPGCLCHQPPHPEAARQEVVLRQLAGGRCFPSLMLPPKNLGRLKALFFPPFLFLFRRICSLGKCWSPHGPTEQRGSRGAWFSERGGLQQDSLSLHPRKPSQVLRPFKQTAAVNTYPCLWPPWKTQVHSPNNQETQMREIRCRHAEFSSTRGNAGTPGCPV